MVFLTIRKACDVVDDGIEKNERDGSETLWIFRVHALSLIRDGQ